MNPHKLIFCFGPKGCGKTTYMVSLAYKYQKKGRPVYSNVMIPGCYMYNDEDVGIYGFPPNAVILMDEVSMIWDNRDFKNFKKYVSDYFRYQRHQKNLIYMFSQTFDIDIKLRRLTDQMYLMTNFMNCFTMLRRVIIKPDVVQTSTGESKIADVLKFDSLLLFWCGSIQFIWLPKWVGNYDSFEPLNLKEKDFVKVEGKIGKNNLIRKLNNFRDRLNPGTHMDKEISDISKDSPDPKIQPAAEAARWIRGIGSDEESESSEESADFGRGSYQFDEQPD